MDARLGWSAVPRALHVSGHTVPMFKEISAVLSESIIGLASLPLCGFVIVIRSLVIKPT